mgnify:FL=1
MIKNYFQLDKVSAITLTYERETSYKWFSAIPAKPKMFLGIKYGMTPAILGGWSEFENGHVRKQSSYFADYSWYKVDEVNKKVYNKAHISIRFNYKESYGINFNSNEEAQQYVDDLIASSDKKFTVIINK